VTLALFINVLIIIIIINEITGDTFCLTYITFILLPYRIIISVKL